LSPNEIDEDSIERSLSTVGIPDPDLVIRTSGEERLSNFLLWQSAYSEFYFSSVLWPDFSEKSLMEALQAYRSRDRRF
ncbi:MAG: undecaprenyl diphosphate synthase family protein, partial [Dolichospermum sp.]